MADGVIGVDVGTGAARAGVFDRTGRLLGTGRHAIDLHRGDEGVVEQSGEQIWRAVCESVRASLAEAGLGAEEIAGIGFDAACSLVVRDSDGEPLPVGDSDHPERDVIVWMDHRAVDQAARINAGEHAVLRYVGGRISPEMQTPKLLWLKENRRNTYDAAAHFFDLSDFLAWKATGAVERSACTVTCKWTYLAHESRWDPDYFRAIGLGDLPDDDFGRIGPRVVAPGTALGSGLTATAADALGLAAGTPVGAGLIDAHAGGVGTVAASGGVEDPTRCMAYVFGTSSCTMTTTREPAFVPGVWGPYHSAMIPGFWLSEGGQSAAGAAIDQLVTMHPATAEAERLAAADDKSLPEWLADRVVDSTDGLSAAVRLARDLHVVPEFLGNRAPFADPRARAVVAGLGMETGVDSLVGLYVAGLCGIGYGLRQIIETQAEHGASIDVISISGGAGAHPLTRQILADAAGRTIEVTASPEPVLLGSAVLAAVAAGVFPDIPSAMPAMSSVKARVEPATGECAELHQRRYDAFRTLQGTAREVREAADSTTA